MRIAICTDTYFPFISGVVTHIETLKKGLEAQGHQVLIITCSPKVKRHTIKNGVLYCPALTLKKIYGYGFSSSKNLKRLRLLKAFNPDLIHIHTEFSMGMFALFASKKLKKPIVYTLHTMYDDYMFYLAKTKPMQKAVKPAAYMYLRSLANKATEIIGPSLKVVEFLRRCGVEKHVNIIYNTIDLKNFLPENQSQDDILAVKQKLGIQKNDTSLCFVGRLGKEKSLDVLINFIAEKFSDNKNLKLFIIGDGPERDNLQKLIDSLNMQDNIKLLGRIEHSNLPPYYHACDLFTTDSLSEMNSISMLEAMASGLYVLQRLDIYNKNQISVNENGDFFETSDELCKLIEQQMALSPQQKLQRRDLVTQTTKRYGEQEFTDCVINVYSRAIDKYNSKNK